jgi:hypothetical protein
MIYPLPINELSFIFLEYSIFTSSPMLRIKAARYTPKKGKTKVKIRRK